MKINAKLLLITFFIVVIVSAASTLIYHSLAIKILNSQQNKSLKQSVSNFAFMLENELYNVNQEFIRLDSKNLRSSFKESEFQYIDFIITESSDSSVNINFLRNRNHLKINNKISTVRQFADQIPNIIFNYIEQSNNRTIFFGKIISENFLADVSEKINAQAALVINQSPYVISNSQKNNRYKNIIENTFQSSSYLEKGNIYKEELENSDYFATSYLAQDVLTPGDNFAFLIFNISTEAHDFKAKMGLIIVILITTGILLSLIFVLLFTTKLRTQVNILSEGAEQIGTGNSEHRVKIISNDEIGKLGTAFNKMLDEINNKDVEQKNYSEFITLINENPTLAEVSDAALTKIIKSTNFTYGLLYLVEEDDKLRLLSLNGVNDDQVNKSNEINVYNDVLEKHEIREIKFLENFPVIQSGALTLKINYLIISPIIYNKKVIGILELGTHTLPLLNVKHYLTNIHEQLAVGLTNAAAFERSENLVNELQLLNEDFQTQNEQITEQNQRLIALHNELSKNASELEDQKEKAIESARVKSQFLATMSHELRTPLNSILGLSELVLKEKGVLDKTKERMNIILRNGRRLLNIISNILEFSKLDYGKIEVSRNNFLLAEMIKQLSVYVEPLVYEKNLKFTIEYPTDVEVVLNSDKSKLEQILLNLITNAIKFTEEGSIKIIISVNENLTTQFKVIDTGIGISDDDLEIIFEEFRQVDSTASRKYGGAGLGLAICKRHTELLGGELSVISKFHKGTEFTLNLPNSFVSDKNDLPINSRKLTYTSDITINRKNILLITRNNKSIITLQKYLDSDDISTTLAETGKDGLEQAGDLVPDLITIDIELSDMSGWQVLMELKNNPETANIPVVMVSISEDDELCFEIDSFDFIFKNSSNDQIRAIIDNVKKYNKTEIKNILTVDYGDEALANLKNEFGEYYSFNNMFVEDNIFEYINENNPDLLLINLIAPSFDEFYFLNELKQNSETRKLPAILSISPNLSESEIGRINRVVKILTNKAQHHPLDILKVIRRRLRIENIHNFNLLNSSKLADAESPSKLIPLNNNNGETQFDETILIVDDDEDTLFTVSEIVRNLGFKTLIARNGIDCLLLLDNLKPDLVLLDIMMPKMDGFEAIKKIREDKSISDIPVFALTAQAMLDNKEVVEKNGFDDLVTKPIDTSLLAFKIGKILKKDQLKVK